MANRPERVLLTGAAGAFGTATATALRRRGVAVRGLDLGSGDGVYACDICDPGQVTSVVGAAIADLGGLDAVVHFAGIGAPVDAGAAPDALAERTLQVNLLGPWRVTAAAIDELVRARGRAVFVASELAYATLPFAAAYATSKRGLSAYADALRMEYGSHVAVTTIYPGYVPTPIHDASIAAGLSMEGRVRKEKVEDVVGTVLRVLAVDRPPRDTATTRAGNVELWLARHLPRLTDAAVRWRTRTEIRHGRYDGVDLAKGMVDRVTGGTAGEEPNTSDRAQRR